jgi:tripartite-type tricarboxylate transporter receptor subunit TctC
MRRLFKSLVVLLLLAAPGVAQADAVSDFYKGKSIRLIISGESGGTYDSDGRLIARHLSKHIPGNPTIVAENMLGASGRVAANYLYNAAPKDGTVIAILQQSVPLGQALGESGIQYDSARFNWLGSPVRPDETLVVWHTTGVKTIEDAKKK